MGNYSASWEVERCARCGNELRGHDYHEKIVRDCAGWATAQDLAREQVAGTLRWPVSRLLAEACVGVASAFAGADHGLLQVRGYLVFPKAKLFMEHWWCRRGELVVDPLTRAAAGTSHIERIEVGAEKSSEYEGVGLFDCLALTGRCQRKNGPCEWCAVRLRLEQRGLSAYELSMPAIGPVS